MYRPHARITTRAMHVAEVFGYSATVEPNGSVTGKSRTGPTWFTVATSGAVRSDARTAAAVRIAARAVSRAIRAESCEHAAPRNPGFPHLCELCGATLG